MGPTDAEAEVRYEAVVRGESPGIWIFIAFDCASFALLFFVFMVERFGHSAQFDRSAQALDWRLGFTNTLILISGSWLVAKATEAARDGNLATVRRWLISAVLVASGFGIIKTIEYTGAIQAGHADFADEFFTFYFALTGIHLLHYVIGMGALIWLAREAGAAGAGEDPQFRRWLAGGALFWHMVDLLWVSLFAMLYLIGAR